jgi:Carboxypeptidase regulatory-like domain/Photosynthesis system II assembly factor YCF48
MQNVPKIVQQRLRAMTPAVNHPDADVLTAFAERSLPEAERSVVLDHMARCGDCRDVVALALPDIEPVEIAVRPSPSVWTWPALRWGLVAAGVVAIASFSLVQYQRHSQTAFVAVKQSPSLEIAANEPKKQDMARFADAAPVEKRDKLQTPATPAFADSLDSAAQDNREKKSEARTDISPAQAVAPTAGPGNRPHEATLGGQLAHGPRLANQWPQQNLANNATSQVSTVPPPAAFAKPQAAPVGVTQAQSMDAESATQTSANENGDSLRVGKAKAAVPALANAAVATTNQPAMGRLVQRQKVQGAPGQIGGYVVDPSGAVVANARITITPANGQAATAVTDSQGAWLIAGLPTGTYKAQAEASGFNTAFLKVNNDPNRFSMYSFTLSVGSAAETVEVSGQNSQVEAEIANAANPGTNNATSNTVRQTPSNGRSFDVLSHLKSATWSISATGGLQRSVDQGLTWQMVDVNASPSPLTNSTSVEVVSKTSRATRAKGSEKDAAKAGNQSFGTVTFRAIAAAGSEVWAGGNAGALYHTVDTGSHWTRVAPASGEMILTGDIIRVDFPDSQHGSISTSSAEVWNTSDDGQTWQKQ